MEIRIIFAQVGLGPDLRFVEVEDVDGRGVSVGAWSVDNAGLRVLALELAVGLGDMNVEPDAILACAAILTLRPEQCAVVLHSALGQKRMDRALDAAMGWASIVHSGWTGPDLPLLSDQVPNPGMVYDVRRVLRSGRATLFA